MSDFGNKVMDEWKSSVIIQGMIALVVTITISVMYMEGKPVPVELIGLVTLIIGYYFGAKSNQQNQPKR